MVRKKDRRSSGYITPNLTISKKELIENDLFVNSFYDDWCDWRDGMRNWFGDFKLIKRIPWKTVGFYHRAMWEKRMRMNLKQKKLLRMRRYKKWKKLH